MTSLLSLKLLVRCFEGLGLAAGPGQVEPPCALGCGWTLGCSRQALSTQPPVSLGGSASAGWAAQGVRLACGAWAYASRAPVGAFNFCEKPLFTEKKKKDKLLLSVAGFLFYVFAFMQIIWRWIQPGEFREWRPYI